MGGIYGRFKIKGGNLKITDKNRKMFYKNKKGDMTILLFVILVLLVTSATTFSFIMSSGKTEAKISNARFIETLYSKQDLAEFYLIQAGEIAIVKTYNSFVEEDNYINNPIYNSKEEVEFKELHSKLSENFHDKFVENFKTGFDSYDFEDDYLKNLKETINDGDFEITVDREALEIVIDSWGMNDSLNDINITYTPEISLKFDLKKIGLHSFEEIYEIKERCKGDENIENCFSDLINFDVSVVEKEKSDGQKYFFMTCTTKKEFLIEDRFDSIRFSFVLK